MQRPKNQGEKNFKTQKIIKIAKTGKQDSKRGQSDRQLTEIATFRLNQPSGQYRENIVIFRTHPVRFKKNPFIIMTYSFRFKTNPEIFRNNK